MVTQKNGKTKRLLTVSAKFQRRKYESINVPYLRLVGKWFAAAGFKIGDLAEVEVNENSIIIKKSNLRLCKQVTVTKWLLNDAGRKEILD